MEKICGNCAHFVQLSNGVCEHHWGSCIKYVNGKEESSFKWDDKSCEDFKPKKKENNNS